MGGVPRSEVICSLSYSGLFFDHLPTSSSLILVNPHWNCVCSALQTSSLLSLVLYLERISLAPSLSIFYGEISLSGVSFGTNFQSNGVWEGWFQTPWPTLGHLKLPTWKVRGENLLVSVCILVTICNGLVFRDLQSYEPLLCHYPERECGFALPLERQLTRA